MLDAAYRKYADYVFGVCMKFAAGDRDWALDRAHDTFLRLHEKLSSLNVEQDLRPWLRTVAVNECLMDLRRRERRQRLLGLFGFASEQAAARPDRDATLRRDVIALDRALGRLPAKQRVLLGLIYFEGETLSSAAQVIGISKGQASKLRARALESLSRQEWETDS